LVRVDVRMSRLGLHDSSVLDEEVDVECIALVP
jgi:hypothetical protein